MQSERARVSPLCHLRLRSLIAARKYDHYCPTATHLRGLTAVDDNSVSAPTSTPEIKLFSDDYNKINSITHRKWATVFHAPALTWHRAFWVRDIYEGANNTPADANDKKIFDEDPHKYVKTKLDNAIISVRKSIIRAGGTVKINPIVNCNAFLFNKVVCADCFIGMPIDGIPSTAVRGLTERESDIFKDDGRVVTLEFDLKNVKFVIRIELRAEYFSITSFANFSDNKFDSNYWENIEFNDFAKNYKLLSDYMAEAPYYRGDEKNVDRCVVLDKYFHTTFWNLFMFDKSIRDSTESVFIGHIFKNVFCDFRGVILSNNTTREKIDSFNDRFNLKWGYDLDYKLRCLLGKTQKYECTANYVMDGRGLYISTLGPQDPEWPDERIIPVEYILYVQQGDTSDSSVRAVNSWQLGRFIDRLHLFGTVRLAALKYFRQLIEVGASLSRFDPVVTKARKAVEKYRKTTPAKIKKFNKRAHRKFAAITEEFNRASATKSGILYRIERSRYYSDQFTKHVHVLRIVPIEGYQPYNKFVERRLGAAYDFIDRLGVRYERAASSLFGLDQYYITTQTNLLGERIGEIQAVGEIVLFFALVPYYLGSIVEDISEHIIKTFPNLTEKSNDKSCNVVINENNESKINDAATKSVMTVGGKGDNGGGYCKRGFAVSVEGLNNTEGELSGTDHAVLGLIWLIIIAFCWTKAWKSFKSFRGIISE